MIVIQKKSIIYKLKFSYRPVNAVLTLVATSTV